MTLISSLVILSVISIYFIYKSYVPIIYEYSRNMYVIRRNNLFLDIDSYIRFSSIIWKSNNEKLFCARCVTSNLELAKNILIKLNT